MFAHKLATLGLLLAGISQLAGAATTYNLVKDYSGSSFFDDWTFFDHFDNLTNGDVVFVSASTAASSKLAFVDPTTNHAIIKVDNTSAVPFNEKRNSVRISTNDRYGVGSVWIADMFHVPFGCSVWPAWWSQAPGWPAGGEIDTFEGVNLGTLNQMSLHTQDGCKQAGQMQSSPLVNSTDCSSNVNNNQGCIVTDPRTSSYGAGFAASGGGVFVTEYAASGISIWFFPRANVPSALSSNASTLDTSTLGLPVANWPTGGCNMGQFFGPQNLILDITLCGDFAKPPAIFQQTCSGVCYNDFVVGNGSVYGDAFFDIASVRVFGLSGTNPVVSGSSPSGASPSSGSGSSGGSTAAAAKFATPGTAIPVLVLFGSMLFGGLALFVW